MTCSAPIERFPYQFPATPPGREKPRPRGPCVSPAGAGGTRHRAHPAPRRPGPDRGAGGRDHEPGAVHAPVGSRDYGTGNVYEIRTYTYAPGDIPKVLEAWAKAVPAREELSPLAACWTSELGGLNKFLPTWGDKGLGERARIREEAPNPAGEWPPQ